MAKPEKKAAKKAAPAKAEKTEKVATTNGGNFEKLQKTFEDLKVKAKEARSALQSFTKKNGLGMKEAPADKKLKPEFEKLTKAYETLKSQRDAAEEAAKASKPRSERASKYDYPADVVTSEDKKKFRAAQRKANKPAKEKAPAKEKPSKKVSKKEEVVAPAKTSKKTDKKKKKVSKKND
jgi:hypothetical protein